MSSLRHIPDLVAMIVAGYANWRLVGWMGARQWVRWTTAGWIGAGFAAAILLTAMRFGSYFSRTCDACGKSRLKLGAFAGRLILCADCAEPLLKRLAGTTKGLN